jgi:eukaryotic-like serine/threonine-protein kinase
MAALQPMTPLALERVVKKCLAKDPDERWQSAKDLSSELSWIGESGGDTARVVPLAAERKTREALAWLLACVSAVALIVGLISWRSSKPLQQSMYFHAPLPFSVRDVALAPNGHTVAIVAYSESARKNVIWIYEPGSTGARILPDTEAATYPFWAPDGQSFAFFADGRLKRLELSSGQIHTICDAPSGRGGTWNKDGVIVFAPKAAGGLYRVSASGGTAMLISEPDKSRGEQSQRWPVFLPDGKHYLYMAANFTGRKGVDGIFVVCWIATKNDSLWKPPRTRLMPHPATCSSTVTRRCSPSHLI